MGKMEKSATKQKMLKSAPNLFTWIAASWTEKANAEHLLQLMFNPWFQTGWLYKPVQKRLRRDGSYAPRATLRKRSLLTPGRWVTMTHCLLAYLDIFTICSQSCQHADIKVSWCSLLFQSQWSWIVIILQNEFSRRKAGRHEAWGLDVHYRRSNVTSLFSSLVVRAVCRGSFWT